jgi:uncharacterized protein YjbI with pentapeptide repeats
MKVQKNFQIHLALLVTAFTAIAFIGHGNAALVVQAEFTSTFTPRIMVTPTATPQTTGMDTREQLELEKLEIEIDKLRKESESLNLSAWLQAGTLTAAFAATVVSLWSAFQSRKGQTQSLLSQIHQQQQDRISSLLHELGSDHVAVRVSAVQALSEYSDAFPFLTNLLKVETNQAVIAATTTALQRLPAKSLPLLIDINKDLFEQEFKLGGELIGIGVSKKDVVDKFLLDNAKFTLWLNSSVGKRTQHAIKTRIAVLSAAEQRDESAIQGDEQKAIFSDWVRLKTAQGLVIKTMETVISAASRLEEAFSVRNAILVGAILENLDLSNWDFTKCDLSNSSFRGAICKGANFSSANASQANFRDADLRDATFDRADLKSTNFNHASLQRANFQNSSGQGVKFFSAKLLHANFSHAHLPSSYFEKCFANKAIFEHAYLAGVSFSNIIASDAKFSHAVLHGAKFLKAQLHRSDFTMADFVGADLTNADFDGAVLKAVKFESIGHYQGSSFRKAVISEAVFGKGAEGFSDYVFSEDRPGS